MEGELSITIPRKFKPRWKAKDINKQGHFCLIDNLESLVADYNVTRQSEYPKLKEMINQNPRLRALMGQRRNPIVELPAKNLVARHFYCACCGKIPFPWAVDHEKEKIRECVYMCRNRHPVCRTCVKMFHTCVFSMQDYMEIFNLDSSPDSTVIQRHTKPVYDSSTTGLGTIRVCSQPISKFNNKNPTKSFLERMILSAEFACKNYYNWCAFRGQGKRLSDHENHCPFRDETAGKGKSGKLKVKADNDKDKDGPKTTINSETHCVDADESSICNFNMKEAIKNIGKIVREIKVTHGNDIEEYNKAIL